MKNVFVPFEKRSKKEQRKLAAVRRGSWNGVKPATRIIEDGRRKKLEQIKRKESKREMQEV